MPQEPLLARLRLKAAHLLYVSTAYQEEAAEVEDYCYSVGHILLYNFDYLRSPCNLLL